MLCQKCWEEEARVHFTLIGPGEAHERAYCLACAQQEPLSWLLVWGYAEDPWADHPTLPAQVLPVHSAERGAAATTLVGIGVTRCECGCNIVVGAELPSTHHPHALLDAPMEVVEHICHCGRDVRIPVPILLFPEGNPAQAGLVVASVETCLWDDRRRRMVAIDEEMRGGRVSWGTFALLN